MRLVDIDKAIEIWKDKDFIRLVGQEEKAKEMLNLLPTVEMDEDCVSRDDAFEVLDDFELEIEKGRWDSAYPKARARMMSLPSVTPQPKKGKWIERSDDEDDYLECPTCHKRWNYLDNDFQYFDFCPKCGTDMREVQG